MRLLDKVVIITGGGNGLGKAYAQAMAVEGALIALVDLDDAPTSELVGKVNDIMGEKRAIAIHCDVTRPEEVDRLRAETLDAFGRIDVLVNNVGSYPHQDFADVTYEAWRRVMAINLDSAFLCTRSVLPTMREQGSGKIINIATNLVWIGLAGMVPYVTAKAAIVGFTRSLAKEVGPLGITVNAIAPGAVVPHPESLNAAAAARLSAIVDYQCVKRSQTERDVMGVAVFLASDESNFMSGQIVTVDGGLTSH